MHVPTERPAALARAGDVRDLRVLDPDCGGASPRSPPGGTGCGGDALEAARNEWHDVVVTGGLGLVRALAAADLVDEHRLMTFPTLLGRGERLFTDCPPTDLDHRSTEQRGPAVLTRYTGATR